MKEMRYGATLLAAIALIALGGCRVKSWESFEAATTPNPPGEWKGDEYASAGIANATGGQNTKTRYADGAKNTQVSGLNAEYGNPIKGRECNRAKTQFRTRMVTETKTHRHSTKRRRTCSRLPHEPVDNFLNVC